MSLLKSRFLAVVAGAAVLGAFTTTGAVAAKMITGDDIKNYSISAKDLSRDAVNGSKLADGSIGASDLKPGLATAIDNASSMAPGASLAGSLSESATITNIGGPFTTNATRLGSFELEEAGTYVINGYAFFDSVAADSPRTDGTHLELALRTVPAEGEKWGKDLGTCFTGAFPQGDRELTCQSVRTVTVDGPTVIDVFAFGYNDDQSGTGGGSFTVASDVSALKVG